MIKLLVFVATRRQATYIKPNEVDTPHGTILYEDQSAYTAQLPRTGSLRLRHESRQV